MLLLEFAEFDALVANHPARKGPDLRKRLQRPETGVPGSNAPLCFNWQERELMGREWPSLNPDRGSCYGKPRDSPEHRPFGVSAVGLSPLTSQRKPLNDLSGGVWTMSSTTSYPPRVQGNSRSRSTVREHRAAATAAGILYIIGTVAGILSKVLTYFPVRNADDPLAYAAKHSGTVATGALLVLVMGLSLALVPVVLFPVLRRLDEVLATGYLIIRGAVEATTYVIVATAWLLLVPLADTMAAGPGTASRAGERLGKLVIDSDGASVIMSLVFCFGGALFYVLLFRSRIVPRWIASWGLIGVPLYAAAYLLAMYGVVGINSSQVNLLSLPLAVQEMVLAVWMIVRGFRPAAVSPTSDVKVPSLAGS